MEFHPLRRELIQRGRPHVRVAVAAQERVTLVVGEHEQDVRSRGRSRENRGQADQHGKNETKKLTMHGKEWLRCYANSARNMRAASASLQSLRYASSMLTTAPEP